MSFKNIIFKNQSPWGAPPGGGSNNGNGSGTRKEPPSLDDIIKNLYRILKPNGAIFIAVPNLNSYDANYYKSFWAAYDVPIHLWHFSKKTISLIFKKNKLRLVKTKPLIFDSFYVSLLSEKYKKNKAKYLKAFLIGLISNIVGIFSSRGHSSNIYIFKKDSF